MNNLNPSIINRIRAESNVGLGGLEHTHHIPRRTEAVEHDEEGVSVTPEERSALPPSDKENSRFALFLRSALRGIRRQDYGSAET